LIDEPARLTSPKFFPLAATAALFDPLEVIMITFVADPAVTCPAIFLVAASADKERAGRVIAKTVMKTRPCLSLITRLLSVSKHTRG